VPARAAALVKEVRDLKKHLSAGPRAAEFSPEKLLAEALHVGEVTVVVAEAPGADAQGMRQIIDQLRKKASPIAVLLGSHDEEKVTLVAGISRELEEQGLNAGQWIRAAAEVVGGRGGGRADLAQAGGKHPEKLPEALAAARESFAGLMAKT
jgi:alanyl-tRNA synthetase